MKEIRALKFSNDGVIDNTTIRVEFKNVYGCFEYLDSRSYATERQFKNFIKKWANCLKYERPVELVIRDRVTKKETSAGIYINI